MSRLMRDTTSCVRRGSVRKPRSNGCVYCSVMFAPKLGLKVEKMLVDSHRELSQAMSYRPPPHFICWPIAGVVDAQVGNDGLAAKPAAVEHEAVGSGGLVEAHAG